LRLFCFAAKSLTIELFIVAGTAWITNRVGYTRIWYKIIKCPNRALNLYCSSIVVVPKMLESEKALQKSLWSRRTIIFGATCLATRKWLECDFLPGYIN
jgi:hypothetical protein